MKKNIPMLVGLILVVASILSSIIFKFYFWYSLYVIGSFCFFGSLNYKSKFPSVFRFLLENKWKRFLQIYLAVCGFGFFVDIIYGRNIANLWIYPHLNSPLDIILPVFIYYPFGGLQVYEMFYFLKNKLAKYFSNQRRFSISNKSRDIMSKLLITFLAIGFIIPVANFLFNGNKHANEIMIIVMILVTFSFDAIIYKLKGESIFFDLLEGKYLMFTTMFATWLLAVILSEIPNIFSREWIYHNVPFVNLEIFKINILIFTFGWFFLVFAPIRGIDLIKMKLASTENKQAGEGLFKG